MLTVKTSAQQSDIDGIGLFAAQRIPKGTVVWKFDARFDIVFSPQEVADMDELQQQLIKRYAYLSTTTGKYVYSLDDTRFTNHSATKNNIDIVAFPGEPETCSVANRDIEIGEEILENYRDFDAQDERAVEAYLDQ